MEYQRVIPIPEDKNRELWPYVTIKIEIKGDSIILTEVEAYETFTKALNRANLEAEQIALGTAYMVLLAEDLP